MNPYELLKPPAARPGGRRMYSGANISRLTSDWTPTSSSQDAEVVTSLRVLRNRSRALVRDNEYALNGVRQIKQNVIGTGIGLQGTVKNTRGKLALAVNDNIEECFHDWWKDSSSVHTAGLMDGPAIERYLIHNLVESGEAFCRLVHRPFGESQIPLAIEVFESDRVMDQWTQQTSPAGNAIRMGVEIDQWHRPLQYWCWPNHPGDWQFHTFQPSAFVQYPASDIIHLYVIDRWPQTRGVPWFHATMKRLNNMGGYEEAEIVRARASAAIMGFIQSPEAPDPDDVVDGKRVDDMEPGQIRHLLGGETFSGFNPSSPNTAVDPFMRLMIRGVAAGLGMSYETLSRDYSNTNYSSARAAQLEDRDLWRVIQGQFIGAFRRRLHKEFLAAAVLAGGISNVPDFFTNEKKYRKAHFKPRGWSWIDPQKEVIAYQTAVRGGVMTLGDVIGQTNNGKDVEDVMKERRTELDMAQELDLVFDTDPAQVSSKGVAQPGETLDPGTEPAAEPPQGEAGNGQSANKNGGRGVPLLSFSTRVGDFFIVQRRDRFHPIFKGRSLGSYATVGQAVEDLANGHTHHVDATGLGISADPQDWDHVSRATRAPQAA